MAWRGRQLFVPFSSRALNVDFHVSKEIRSFACALVDSVISMNEICCWQGIWRIACIHVRSYAKLRIACIHVFAQVCRQFEGNIMLVVFFG